MSKKILINSLCGGCLLFFTATQVQAEPCGNFKTQDESITINAPAGYVVDAMFSPDGTQVWSTAFCKEKSTCKWKYDGSNCPTGNPAAAFSIKFVKASDEGNAAIGKAVIDLTQLKPKDEVNVEAKSAPGSADTCIVPGTNYKVVHITKGTTCSKDE